MRDLNRNTIDSIGQNLTKWDLSQQPRPTHAQKQRALETILDSKGQHMPPTTTTTMTTSSGRGDIYFHRRKEQAAVAMMVTTSAGLIPASVVLRVGRP